jgi:hypothetical protein
MAVSQSPDARRLQRTTTLSSSIMKCSTRGIIVSLLLATLLALCVIANLQFNAQSNAAIATRTSGTSSSVLLGKGKNGRKPTNRLVLDDKNDDIGAHQHNDDEDDGEGEEIDPNEPEEDDDDTEVVLEMVKSSEADSDGPPDSGGHDDDPQREANNGNGHARQRVAAPGGTVALDIIPATAGEGDPDTVSLMQVIDREFELFYSTRDDNVGLYGSPRAENWAHTKIAKLDAWQRATHDGSTNATSAWNGRPLDVSICVVHIIILIVTVNHWNE